MCGLFGAIGYGWNQGTLRALAWANRERGTDSLGFFDSSGKMMKSAGDPLDCLGKENVSGYLDNSEVGCEKRDASWFIAGHTRLATRGQVNRQNSHPFRYGNIVGSHNGMVDAPQGYVVDSQYLFDTLNKTKGDYNKAWADITGYWGVSWYDGKYFYLQVHNGDIALGLAKDGCWYYSSNKTHLAACIGHTGSIIELKEGQTLRFTVVDGVVVMDEVAELVITAPDYWMAKYGCSNTNATTNWANGYSGGGRRGKRGRVKGATYYEDSDGAYYPVGSSKPVDYDEEWRTAWEDYTSQSEHSRIS